LEIIKLSVLLKEIGNCKVLTFTEYKNVLFFMEIWFDCVG